MTLTMRNLERLSLSEMQDFLSSSRNLELTLSASGRYGFLERVLERQRYRRRSKSEKGVVRRFLAKASGLSRAQLTRLISRWTKARKIERRPAYRPRFPSRYTAADIALLAALDAAHEQLSGPATRRLLERAYQVFGDESFARLAGISVSHIYNLRASADYRKIRIRLTRTQTRQVAIGERRKPDPRGRPGYLRVDTVHQGHHDGQRGLYHINAVDTVTQWQVVGCVETISERHLAPVLEAMLHQFCFRIRGFHCDNGSEFVNHTVAKLLDKLLIEFTKSRPYRTTDNALVEGKNGAVIRKQIGYGLIAAEHAEEFQKFYTAYFNPYLNFHRPCGFATVVEDARGRRRRLYPSRDYCTPYEKLRSLPDWESELKEGVGAKLLEAQAERMSDTEAAQRMQKAKNELLAKYRSRQR
jgi:Integrase core domain